MYKYLLCWRYLRTRYIALASVVSVMLGVATMIVVNSVMAGFADKMRDRLHGVLADVVVESFTPRRVLQLRRGHGADQEVAGDEVDRDGPDDGDVRRSSTSASAARSSPGRCRSSASARGAGQDRRLRRVPGRRRKGQPIPPSFEVPEKFKQQTPAGEMLKDFKADPNNEFDKLFAGGARRSRSDEQAPDAGAILGYALATFHQQGPARPSSSPRRAPRSACSSPGPARPSPRRATTTFTIVGYFKSGMSEYDSTHVYVPLERLQKTRLLNDVDRAAARSTRSRSRSGRASTSTTLAAEDPDGPRQAAADVLPGLRPGSRSRARCWRRSPSSRAS